MIFINIQHVIKKNWMKFILLFFIMGAINISVSVAQNRENGFLKAEDQFNKSRFYSLIISEVAVSTIATIGLQYLWYKKFPKSKFHFFNDNNEWLNMDKVGHATTAYNISAIQYNALRWCGVNKSNAILGGGFTGLAYLTFIEISDGFSAQWGFSKGDMAANLLGVALFASQQYAWNQQKIQLRFSYHTTGYAKYNPKELGENLAQRLLKDYNGQTYWLSVNVHSLLKQNSGFPKWINADFGYGAEGMIGAVTNPSLIDGKPVPEFVRRRELFFSVDGAFAKKDNTPYPAWINIIHLPVPVVELKTKSRFPMKFKTIYF